MQNVSQSYLDFINDSNNIGRSVKNKVVIDNVEYLSDIIKSNPKISHKATSFIGGFPAKTCEFEIFNLDGSLSLNNKEIEVYKGLEDIYPVIKMTKDETTGKYYLDGESTQKTIPSPDIPSEIINTYKAGTYKTKIEGVWYKITIAEDLKSLPKGTADRLWVDIDNLSVECIKAIGSVFLDGSENWGTVGSTNSRYYTNITDIIDESSNVEITVISDKLNGTSYGNLYENNGTDYLISNCGINGGSKRIFISTNIEETKISSVEELKSWLSENPIAINYELAEKETIECDINTYTIEWIKMGIFKAKDEDITTNLTQKSIYFKGTDRRTLFDDKYNSNLAYPATGLQIIQDICDKLGVTLETTNFNMANYLFTKKPNFSDTTTFTEAVARMAEAGGEIAYISNNGGLKIVEQTATGQTIPKSKRSNLTKEKQFGAINTVVLGHAGYDDDIVYPSEIAVERIEWKITDNPYFDLNREEIIETIANNIIGKSVIPYTIENFVDDFIYDLNDVISVVDNDGNTFDAVILQYETTNRIKSKIAVPAQTGTTTNYNAAGNKDSNKISNSIKFVVNHLEQVIEAIASKLIDTSSYVDFVTSLNTLGLKDTAKSKAMIKKLTIKGFAAQELYLSESTYLSDNTYLGNVSYLNAAREYCITIKKDNTVYDETTSNLMIVDALYNAESEEITYPDNYFSYNQNTQELESETYKHYITLSEPLKSGVFNDISIHDELVIENNKCFIIRRLGIDDNGDLYVLDEVKKEEYGEIELETIEGNTYISVDNFTNLQFECDYMKKNEYCDYYATEVLNNSSFTLTNENISSKVSKDHILSEINQSPELIKILANKIQLEGYTTINGGFAVDEKGNASIANGAVKINTDGIEMATGTKIVGGEGMLTNIQNESDWNWLGLMAEESIEGLTATKTKLKIQTHIPEKFVVKQAKLTLIHAPIHYSGESYDELGNITSYDFWGYCRNIRLYKNTDSDYSITAALNSEYNAEDNSSYSEISNAFGANGFTAKTPTNNSHVTEKITSIDFANEIQTGFNEFILETATNPPSLKGDYIEQNINSQTGRAFAVLSILGYMSV